MKTITTVNYYTDVMQIYRGECVMCGEPAVTLHEEPPKSLNPRWKEEPWNQYAVCNSCHSHVHTISRADAQTLLTFYRKTNFPYAEQKLLNLVE